MKNSLGRIVYVNGDYVKEENAVISVFDRGFIFGDGIYEVVPVINGKLVDKQYFLERLERSLDELSIAWPCCKEEYMAVMNQLIIKNNLKKESCIHKLLVEWPTVTSLSLTILIQVL